MDDAEAARLARRERLPDVDTKRMAKVMLAMFLAGLALFLLGFWLLGKAGGDDAFGSGFELVWAESPS